MFDQERKTLLSEPFFPLLPFDFLFLFSRDNVVKAVGPFVDATLALAR